MSLVRSSSFNSTSPQYMASLQLLPVSLSTNSCLAILAFCTFLFSRWISARRLVLPPGPRPVPFIGNLHQISFHNQELCFADWGRSFGTVFSRRRSPVAFGCLKRSIGDVVYFKVFARPMIVLNTLKAARDLMEQRSINYSCRPRFVLLVEM